MSSAVILIATYETIKLEELFVRFWWALQSHKVKHKVNEGRKVVSWYEVLYWNVICELVECYNGVNSQWGKGV